MTDTSRPWLLAWARWMRERRGAALTLTLTLLVIGTLTASQMPVQLLPRIDYPQVRVIADLPGQSAEVIESALNAPLEEALSGVRGLRTMQSRSGDERSYIDLFFRDRHDTQQALADVTAAVQQASSVLPPDLPRPRIFPVSTADEPALIIAIAEGARDTADVRSRLRAQLLPALRNIDGVAAVHVGRTETQELVVDVQPHALAHAGASTTALLAALRATIAPPVHATLRDHAIEVLARHGHVQPTADTLRLVSIPTPHGSIPLEDVATIAPATSQAHLPSRLDGHPAVLVEIMRDPDARAQAVARDVRTVLDDWTHRGDQRQAVVLHDDAFLTEAALRGVAAAAIAGAILASLLLLIALRSARHLPAVLLLLPGTLALALLLLNLLGQGLNLMTLTGLLFSIGLGLDYLIIHADRLERERQRDLGPDAPPPDDRAFAAIAGPLLGAQLTTVAAVLPFLLVSGPVAQLFAPMILSVVAASLASFILAMILLPAWGDTARKGTSAHAPDPPSPSGGFRKVAGWTLLATTPAVLLWVSLVSPGELLPSVDDGLVRVRLNVPAGQPIEEVDSAARSLEQMLASLPDTEHVHSTVGGYIREGAPSYRPGEINVFVRVTRQPEGLGSQAWATIARQAVAGLDIPHGRYRWELPRIRGVRTSLADDDVVLVLSHPDGDMRILRDAADALRDALDDVPGLGSFSLSRDGLGTRLVLEADPRVTAAASVDQAELGTTLALAMEGRVLHHWIERGERRDLRVRFDREHAGRSAQLDRLPVVSASGQPLAIGTLVRQVWREEALHIERDEGMRVQRLRASRDGSRTAEATLVALREQLDAAALPDGVSVRLDGEITAARDAMASLLGALLLCILGVLLVLHAQYARLRAALAAVLMLPLAATGGLVLTMVAGLPVSGLFLAGLLIAFGIIANGAILILSEAEELASGGQPGREHVLTAASTRLRPITLTVLTTCLGLSPLLLAGGGVSELLQPLALSVIGALLLSVPLLHLALPLCFARSATGDHHARHSTSAPGESP